MVAALAALIVMRNWQRVGVAANMSLEEFKAARKEVDQHGRALRIVRTMHHKTAGTHGPALVTIIEEDYRLILKYVTRVKVNLDPGNILPQLLVLPGPVPVTKVSQLRGRGRREHQH